MIDRLMLSFHDTWLSTKNKKIYSKMWLNLEQTVLRHILFSATSNNNKHLDWPANEVIPWHGTKSKMTANYLLNYRYRWSSNSKMLLNIFKNSHILTHLRPTCLYYKWAHLNQLIYAYIFPDTNKLNFKQEIFIWWTLQHFAFSSKNLILSIFDLAPFKIITLIKMIVMVL